MTTVDHTTTAPAVHAARALLALGVAAGPLYVLVGMAQVMAREGFDMRRHPLSLLVLGEQGWIQVANFLVSGALVIGGAVGARRLLRGTPVGTFGPLLLGVYGLGLIGSGLFPADPAPDFPLGWGTKAGADGLTRNGILHLAFGGIGFYALIAACLVFARRFARTGRLGWATYSALSGVGFFACFGAVAAGVTAPAAMLAFYAAVAWIWAWHTALLVMLRRELSLPS
jgi:hypothetical protein